MSECWHEADGLYKTGRCACPGCVSKKLIPPGSCVRTDPMRTLTRDELVSEVLTRLEIRNGCGVHAVRMSTPEIVALVAEMIELSRTPVPECYTQATDPAPTRCEGCDGKGYVQSTARDLSYPFNVLCPRCQP